MRESPVQREIIVPGDMRSGRPQAGKAGRRAVPRVDGAAMVARILASLRAGAGSFAARCLNRPGETAGFAVALGAAVYISVNALGFQEGRHPAPILPEPKAAAETHAAAKPAPRPIPMPTREEPSALREPAAELARAPEETTASVSLKADKNVARAQRALTKLGFGPLKDDGMMGPSTRAAIEKFERERKLPVKGEATGKTLRELTARAGLPPG